MNAVLLFLILWAIVGAVVASAFAKVCGPC